MNILFKSNDFTKVQMYKLTAANDIQLLKNIPTDQPFEVHGYVTYEDSDSDGQVKTLASMLTDHGVIATSSLTVMRDLEKLWDVFEGEPFTVQKQTATAKNGREFIQLILVEDAFESFGAEEEQEPQEDESEEFPYA